MVILGGCVANYLKIPDGVKVFKNRYDNLSYSLARKPEGIACEFGVFKGKTARHIAKTIFPDTLYAFDSFKGLPEKWDLGTMSHQKGHFNLKGKLPKLRNNIKPVVGVIEETLDGWIRHELKQQKIAFMHIDVDLYAPTKFILHNLKEHLSKDAVIVFDELADFQKQQIYTNWMEGEYKALVEEIEHFQIISRSETYAVTVMV